MQLSAILKREVNISNYTEAIKFTMFTIHIFTNASEIIHSKNINVSVVLSSHKTFRLG